MSFPVGGISPDGQDRRSASAAADVVVGLSDEAALKSSVNEGNGSHTASDPSISLAAGFEGHSFLTDVDLQDMFSPTVIESHHSAASQSFSTIDFSGEDSSAKFDESGEKLSSPRTSSPVAADLIHHSVTLGLDASVHDVSADKSDAMGSEVIVVPECGGNNSQHSGVAVPVEPGVHCTATPGVTGTIVTSDHTAISASATTLPSFDAPVSLTMPAESQRRHGTGVVKSRLRSWVWDHFSIPDGSSVNEALLVQCIHCERSIKRGKGGRLGTTALTQHLLTVHKELERPRPKKGRATPGADSGEGASSQVVMTLPPVLDTTGTTSSRSVVDCPSRSCGTSKKSGRSKTVAGQSKGLRTSKIRPRPGSVVAPVVPSTSSSTATTSVAAPLPSSSTPQASVTQASAVIAESATSPAQFSPVSPQSRTHTLHVGSDYDLAAGGCQRIFRLCALVCSLCSKVVSYGDCVASSRHAALRAHLSEKHPEELRRVEEGLL